MADDRPWDRAETVAGFTAAAPNPALIDYARGALRPGGRAIDIGCGAGRNALPVAALGWRVTGVDLSAPMLEALRGRSGALTVDIVRGTFDALPLGDACGDLVIAHGIWNLSRSHAQFTAGIREAARVARAGARLFVATFRRQTLALSGLSHFAVSDDELRAALGAAGFEPDPRLPLGGSPILEGGFVRQPGRG